MEIRLKTKFLLWLGIFLILVLANSLISLHYFQRIQSSFQIADNIYPVIKMIKDLSGSLRDSKNWAVRYALEVDPYKLGEWKKNSQEKFKNSIAIFGKMKAITEKGVKKQLQEVNQNLINFSKVASAIVGSRRDLAVHQFKLEKIREFLAIAGEVDENLASLIREVSEQKDLRDEVQRLKDLIGDNRALFGRPLFSPLRVQPEKAMKSTLLERRKDFETGMDAFDKNVTALFPKLTVPTQKRYLHSSKVLTLQMRRLILSDRQLVDLYATEIQQLLAIWKSVEALNVALLEVEKKTDKMANLVNRSLADVKEVLRTSQQMMYVLIFLSIIVFIIFGLGVSIFISRRVLSPIDKLVASTEKIRYGKFDERIPVTSSDEIGQLAFSFNEMTDTLSRSRETLKQASIQISKITADYKQKAGAEKQKLENSVKDLEEKNQKLMVANRMKSEFLTDTSHEFRTQLNSVIGFSELVLRDPKEKLTQKAGKNLTHILDSGRDLLMFINDIVDLSKMSIGKLPVSISEFDLIDLFKDCWASLTNEILSKGKDISLGKAIPKIFPVCVSDAAKVRKIIDHLLHNALRFTEKGMISVSLEQKDGDFVIKIKDAGGGISEGDQKIIFDETKQKKASTPRAFGSSGIELLIVKKLVDALEGQIEIESERDEGACFIVVLPIRYGERKKEVEVEEKIAA